MREAMSAFYTTTTSTRVVGVGTLTLSGLSSSRKRRRNFSAAPGDPGSAHRNVISPWSRSFGDLWPLQLIASFQFAVGEPQRSSLSVLKLDVSRRHSQYQFRIAGTNSSSSSFPGSSGVDEVKNFEDQDDGIVLSAKQRRANGRSKDDEDLANFVSTNGWDSKQVVTEADFAESDQRSQGISNGRRVEHMGEGGTFIAESTDESRESPWERCSEDSAVADNSTASSSLSPPGSPSVGGKEPLYEVIEINRKGKAVQKLVSRRQLLRTKGGLRLRDLRRVDPSLWVTNSAPALLVRDQAILLNLGSLRAIATPEDVLIFDHQSVGARGFMEILIPRLAADKSYGHMPFELEVMESALISRTQRLERALMDVEPRVISLLAVLPTRLTADVLEELRVSKQALVEVGAKAGALRDMLLELLETPQDIRRMTIMGKSCSVNKNDGDVLCTIPQDKQVAEDEEEEIEMLLEYYLQRCESCHGQAEKLLSSAKEMEDSIAVNLSSRRLEVSRLELLLQVGTFCAALGALVAGIFGMNLKSYLEERAMAFWITTAGIILGGTFLYIYIVSYLKNRKIL